jgi:hypothetical protein
MMGFAMMMDDDTVRGFRMSVIRGWRGLVGNQPLRKREGTGFVGSDSYEIVNVSCAENLTVCPSSPVRNGHTLLAF